MTLKTEELQMLIIMRGLGFTQEEIAKEINISRKTVENWLRRLKREAITANRKGEMGKFYLKTIGIGFWL